MREYDRIAAWFVTDRGTTTGVAEALELARSLPPHALILDAGCGNGVPITQALGNAGHRVVGLDSSAGMLAFFRANLPATPVVRGDARQCPFLDRVFDAAIAVGMLFHLPPDDQSVAIESVSRVLKPGAPFLFTMTEIAGADPAGITGTMNGVTFPYFAVSDVRSLIAARELELVGVHDDPGVATYYLARKTGRVLTSS